VALAGGQQCTCDAQQACACHGTVAAAAAAAAAAAVLRAVPA
jgi:hypothetical protein